VSDSVEQPSVGAGLGGMQNAHGIPRAQSRERSRGASRERHAVGEGAPMHRAPTRFTKLVREIVLPMHTTDATVMPPRPGSRRDSARKAVVDEGVVFKSSYEPEREPDEARVEEARVMRTTIALGSGGERFLVKVEEARRARAERRRTRLVKDATGARTLIEETAEERARRGQKPSIGVCSDHTFSKNACALREPEEI